MHVVAAGVPEAGTTRPDPTRPQNIQRSWGRRKIPPWHGWLGESDNREPTPIREKPLSDCFTLFPRRPPFV